MKSSIIKKHLYVLDRHSLIIKCNTDQELEDEKGVLDIYERTNRSQGLIDAQRIKIDMMAVEKGFDLDMKGQVR